MTLEYDSIIKDILFVLSISVAIHFLSYVVNWHIPWTSSLAIFNLSFLAYEMQRNYQYRLGIADLIEELQKKVEKLEGKQHR